eukprot:scaffold525_cov307-Pavlova_lutheri.AAC.16
MAWPFPFHWRGIVGQTQRFDRTWSPNGPRIGPSHPPLPEARSKTACTRQAQLTQISHEGPRGTVWTAVHGPIQPLGVGS